MDGLVGSREASVVLLGRMGFGRGLPGYWQGGLTLANPCQNKSRRRTNQRKMPTHQKRGVRAMPPPHVARKSGQHGRNLGSKMGHLAAQDGSKTGPRRLHNGFKMASITSLKNKLKLGRFRVQLGAQDGAILGSKTGPRGLQNALQLRFNMFPLRFPSWVRFWAQNGPTWVPKWANLGSKISLL